MDAATPECTGLEAGDTLAGFVRLAALVAGTGVAVLKLGRSTDASVHAVGCTPDADLLRALDDQQRDVLPGFAFNARLTLLDKAARPVGVLAVLDRAARGPLDPAQARGLGDVATLIVAVHGQSVRDAELSQANRRAILADTMLRLVAEAGTCAEALTGLLGELCRQHHAPVGRIWQLLPDGRMLEVSRYNRHAYYDTPPAGPVRHGTSLTARSIAENLPLATIYSRVGDPSQFVLMQIAMESGLASQVSYPIWVQEQRFGVALAFSTERDDLDQVIESVAHLANTIRPALFRLVTEERIRFLAHHDELTRLCNRAMFHERLRGAVRLAEAGMQPHAQGVALLYIDLDGFKLVNDACGHHVGDKLLAVVAARLRAGVRECDTVARLGGDEFAVVQVAAGQPFAASQLAQRLLEALRDPIEIEGQCTTVGASIGIACHPAGGTTPDLLLRNADAALYHAKQSGRNAVRLFEPSLTVLLRERRALERDLRAAVEEAAFTLAFQPICDGTTLHVRGLEALLRWTHPRRGAVPPSAFIPIAEATGLIVPLGEWALERACAEAAEWGDAACLSVNLSPLQFRQPGLVERITATLARTGLHPARLDLEVTEGLLLDDAGVALRTMEGLRALGVRMTLDDFGTGYASLSTLRRFPFDRLKIDRSFIRGMVADDGTLAIVEGVLALGRRLALEVVAEGVETDDELALLRSLGCTLVQGFLTGRPVPADAAGRLVSAREAVPGRACA